MEESNFRAFGGLIRGLISGCLSLYMASTVIFFFYFNYFANSPTHPFSEVNAAGKAIVWPYILFFKKKDNESQPNTPVPSTVPKSVELFFRSIEPLNRFGAKLAGFREHPGNPALEKAEAENLKILLQATIDSVEPIDRSELDKIYPGWGEHVENDLLAGLKMMKEGGDTLNKTKYYEGYAKLESWGEWAKNNERPTQDILRAKYNYVPARQ